MVKKKGGRELNPVDAFRKTQRAKEISKNKRGRQFQREAVSLQDDPNALKEELKEIIRVEESGQLNPSLKIKKKALQQAYDQAIRKQILAKKEKESEKSSEVAAAVIGSEDLATTEDFPPLPPGPPPPHAFGGMSHHTMPGTNVRVFPPGLVAGQPEIAAKFPANMLPPPPVPPPSLGSSHDRTEIMDAKQPAVQNHDTTSHESIKERNHLSSLQRKQPTISRGAVISGQSTVVQLPKAYKDKNVTAMVPSTVASRMVARPSLQPSQAPKKSNVGPGFGLVPRNVAKRKDDTNSKQEKKELKTNGDDSYEEFMRTMQGLGAM